jgi:AcrR family transcriptional regulator
VRLTRVQQQQVTHERLLAAGRSAFLARGFLAVTVEEIAAEAGYTRGAVYKHFGGKEGLWLAIVGARAESVLAGLETALGQVSSREDLLATLNPATERDDEAARWAVVSAESLAAIAGQPQHAAAFSAIQRHLDQTVTALLERHCHRLGLQPAIPVTHLVMAWGALGGGLALLRALDPDTPVAATAASVLAALLPASSPTRSPSRSEEGTS